MKKCSYCGAEYLDEALVCAVDHTPLDLPPPTPGGNHSALGIASFCVSIAAGCLLFALVVVAGILNGQRTPGERTYPGQMIVGLVVIFLMGAELVAVGLGIAAICQSRKKRLFGILGLVFSGATILGILGLMLIGLVFMARFGK